MNFNAECASDQCQMVVRNKDPDTGRKSALHTDQDMDCMVNTDHDRSCRWSWSNPAHGLAEDQPGWERGARYEKANGDLIPV